MCEMSGNVSDDPRWLRELEQELRLGDTPAPEAPDDEITIAEAIKRMEFTPKGWERVRELLLRAQEEADPALLRRIMEKSDDDTRLFTAMIALPYQLTMALGYESAKCERLITYIAASYVIAIAKGYELGRNDMRDE